MFWERFYSLCLEKGVKPNSIRSSIGITSPGAMTYWKNKGVIPAKATLLAIAAYFNTTVEYLLGQSDDRTPPALPENEKSAPMPDGTEAQYSDKVIRVAGLIAALPEAKQAEALRYAEFLAQQPD